MASPSVLPANPPNLRVGAEINRGAWGVVYEGDLDGRPVAVKNIHELLRQVGKEELERLLGNFREECARLQALVHPHIVGKECAPVRSAPLAHAYLRIATISVLIYDYNRLMGIGWLYNYSY